MFSGKSYCYLVVLAACGAAPGCLTGPADGARAATAGTTGQSQDQTGLALEAVVPSAAEAICDTLFRCCGEDHRDRYFASFRHSERLKDAGFEGQVPPDASLSAEACPALLAAMLEVEPLGPWVAAAEAGIVTYDGAAAASCLATLRSAACGQPAWGALVDSTCFAHPAPTGGAQQRRMFRRTQAPGASCRALTDGVGGAVYGTCDPDRAWCCRADAEDPARCSLVGDQGTCQAVSAVDESCQYFGGDVQICATGLDCAGISSQGTGTCAALDGDAPLTTGAACYDAGSYSLLGTCQDGYCDLFGSARCESFVAVGGACDEDGQCQSGGCADGACIAAFCEGND